MYLFFLSLRLFVVMVPKMPYHSGRWKRASFSLLRIGRWTWSSWLLPPTFPRAALRRQCEVQRFDRSQFEDHADCLDLCWLCCLFDSACVLSRWKRKSGTSGHRWSAVSVFFIRFLEEIQSKLLKNRAWFTVASNRLVFPPQSPVLCSLCRMTYSSITSRSLEPY